MPQAEEKLAEKPHFDVYAMMLILSGVATLLAILFLHAELYEYWYAGGMPEKGLAVHLTSLNPASEEEKGAGKECDWVVLTQADKEDAKALGLELFAKDFPEPLDPLKTPLSLDPDQDNSSRFPEAERAKMRQEYLEQRDATAVEPSGAPPAPAPPETPPAAPPATPPAPGTGG